MKRTLLIYLLGLARVVALDLGTFVLGAEPLFPAITLTLQNESPGESKSSIPASDQPLTSDLSDSSARRQSVLEYQEKQASTGEFQALYVMGLRYLAGVDVPKDEKRARELLVAAQEKGDLRARIKIQELDRAARKAEAEARAAIDALILTSGMNATNAASVWFSADGTRILTLSPGGAARVWDVQTPSKPLISIDSHTTAEFSPDGKQIITISPDNVRSVWDLGTGRLIERERKR
jgi:hypothetical protein